MAGKSGDAVLSIGALARATGVKPTTIRYYETIGLIGTAVRTQGGHRTWGPEDVERLGFVRHARELGFSLQAIRDLIALSGHPGVSCAGADAIAARQLDAVRSRIARLRALECELERMVHHNHGPVADCRVMAVLADHALCGTDHRQAGREHAGVDTDAAIEEP